MKRLVAFLFDDSHLGYEFRPRPATNGRAIICTYRHAGSEKLLADDLGNQRLRQSFDQPRAANS